MTDEPSEPTPIRREWFIIGAVAAVVLVIVVWISVSDDDDDDSAGAFEVPEGTLAPPEPLEVRYDVSGTATSADITIETPTGTSQQNGVDVPLVRKSDGERGLIFTGFAPGDFVYISAQNQGFGDITCSIHVNDVLISTNTSSGRFAIATCEGSA